MLPAPSVVTLYLGSMEYIPWLLTAHCYVSKLFCHPVSIVTGVGNIYSDTNQLVTNQIVCIVTRTQSGVFAHDEALLPIKELV